MTISDDSDSLVAVARERVSLTRELLQWGFGGLKRSVVRFVTRDKVIQAVATGGAFAVIDKASVNFAIAFNTVLSRLFGVRIPVQTLSLVAIVAVVALALWADDHTEEWREIVEEQTGEEAADDEAE